MKATATRSGAPERPKSSGFKQNSLGNLGAGALELLPGEWEWQKQMRLCGDHQENLVHNR